MPIYLVFLLCCILGAEGSQMGAPTQDRTVFKKEDFYYYNDDYYYYYNDGNLPVLKKQVNFSPPPLPPPPTPSFTILFS